MTESTPKHAAQQDAKHTLLIHKKRAILTGVAVVALLCASIGGILMWQQAVKIRAHEVRRAGYATPNIQLPASEGLFIPNPIDFSSLQAQNSDIYAWVTFPGTEINHPILQTNQDIDYYLLHNLEKQWDEFGEIYTHPVAAKDFSDPVTVVYGHNVKNTHIMLSDMHKLEDEQFFNENVNLNIYTPRQVLTYEIVAFYESDNTMITGSRDFYNPVERQAYFDEILTKNGGNSRVREGATLTASDKIIQFSTCTIPSNSQKRFIVTAKLLNIQKTK